MKPQEQLTLEPYERDHAVVVGIYRYDKYLLYLGGWRILLQQCFVDQDLKIKLC